MPRFVGGFIDVDGVIGQDGLDGGGNDRNTSAARLTDGRIAIAWSQQEEGGAGGLRIYWRVLNPDGSPYTAVGKIDSVYNPGAVNQRVVDVATVTALPGGAFAIGYNDQTGVPGNSSGYRYWTTTFTPNGAGYTGAAAIVGSQTFSYGGHVTTGRDGSLIAAVVDNENLRQSIEVNGVERAGSTTTSAVGYLAQVAAFGDGYLLASNPRVNNRNILSLTAWTSTLNGVSIPVSQQTAGDQLLGATITSTQNLLALPGGGFVVAWHDSTLGGRLRIYDAAGAPLTGELAAADTADLIDLALLPDGTFVLVSNSGRLNHYAADGTELSAGFLLPVASTEYTATLSVTAMGGTRVLLSYVSNEARAQIIDLAGLLTGDDDPNVLTGGGYVDEILGLGGADTLSGLGFDDRLFGGEGADTLNGGAGDDQLTGGAGDDALNGDAGADTALFTGARADYGVARGSASGTWVVTDLRAGSPDGTDTLTGVERLSFSDRTVTLGTASLGLDLGGDGRGDLLFRNTATGEIVQWAGASSGAASFLGGVGVSYDIRKGDLRGDGRTDLVFVTAEGLVLAWDDGDAGRGRYLGDVGARWKIAATGDFDGDGRTDLLFRNLDTNDLITWGGGDAAQGAYKGNLGAVWAPLAADVTGDGKVDLVFQHSGTGDLVLWEGGDSALSRGLGTVGTGWRLATAGDFDGDGRFDLVFQGRATGDLIAWGGGDPASGSYLGQAAVGAGLVSGDYTGDGRSDLIVREGSQISLWDHGAGATAAVVAGLGAQWEVYGGESDLAPVGVDPAAATGALEVGGVVPGALILGGLILGAWGGAALELLGG